MKGLLANLKIFYKMMLGPIVVICFMAIMAGVAYWGFSTQKVSLDNIFKERFDGYKKSGKILNDANIIYADIYRVISWTHAQYDPEKIDGLISKQIPAVDNTIDYVQRILRSPNLLPEEKKQYQAALDKLLRFKEPVAGMMDLIKTDIFSATMFLGAADDSFVELNKALQELMVVEDNLSKKDYDRSVEKYRQVITIFVFILLVAVAFSLTVSFLLTRTITASLQQSMNIVHEIAKGDLTRELQVDSSDEIGELARAVEEMRLKISEMVTQSVSMSQALSEGASNQASSLEETSSSMEELSVMTRHNADNASQVNSLMLAANQMMDKASVSMKELNASMHGIGEASVQTQKIIKTIDEVAFQTNLLALNAAVEAARAGEAGAGFAVVAEEVRNLAIRAADSARNTSTLIEDIVDKIKGGEDLVSASNRDFTELRESIAKVRSLIEEIAAASKEQSQGIEQINRAVAEIDKTTQQNAASAEEMAAIMSVFRTVEAESRTGKPGRQKMLSY